MWTDEVNLVEAVGYQLVRVGVGLSQRISVRRATRCAGRHRVKKHGDEYHEQKGSELTDVSVSVIVIVLLWRSSSLLSLLLERVSLLISRASTWYFLPEKEVVKQVFGREIFFLVMVSLAALSLGPSSRLSTLESFFVANLVISPPLVRVT